ncbi:MAG: hypothetical protein Q4D32_06080, partial [Eubacteriales bacterium]|nr:hypothetical protein [Eubacteriales bacterium]
MKFWKKGIACILVCIMICECLLSVKNGMAAENIYKVEKDGIIYNQGSAMENSREIGDFIVYGATLYVSAGITHFSAYGYRRYHTTEDVALSVDIALLTPDGNVMTMMTAATAAVKQYDTAIFQAEVNGDYSGAYDYTLDYEGNGTLDLPNDTIDNTLRNRSICLMPGDSYTLMSNERAEKVSYRWYYTTDETNKGQRIEGADQYFYQLENVSEDDIGYYYCRVYKNGQIAETKRILIDVDVESDRREEILFRGDQELPDYVIEQTDGKLINKCAAFRRERYIDKYYMHNIWLYHENGQSTLLAKLEDVSGETEVDEDAPDARLCTIRFYNIRGEEITFIGGIVGQTKAGEAVTLSASATSNFIEAYDFRIEFEDTPVTEEVAVDQTIRKKWDVENQMLWLQCNDASEKASYLWYRSDYPDAPGEYFLYGQTIQFGLELDPEYDGYYYCRIWKNGIVKETERVHISMADYMQLPEPACTPDPTPTMQIFATPEPTATGGVEPSAVPEPTATEGVEPS